MTTLKQNWVLEKVSLFSSPVCCEPFRSEVAIATDSWGVVRLKVNEVAEVTILFQGFFAVRHRVLSIHPGHLGQRFRRFFSGVSQSLYDSMRRCAADMLGKPINWIHKNSTSWDASGWSKTPYGNREFRAGNWFSTTKRLAESPAFFWAWAGLVEVYSFARKDGLNEKIARDPSKFPRKISREAHIRFLGTLINFEPRRSSEAKKNRSIDSMKNCKSVKRLEIWYIDDT